MRVNVDMDVCENHAQCVLAAPNVFRLDENGELRYEPSPDNAELDNVREAVELCPVLAITIASEV